LANNKLVKIPDSIGNLDKMEKLDLSNNALTALPVTILNLFRLTKIMVSNNPLVFPPITLCTTKPPAMFKVMKSILRTQSIPGSVSLHLEEPRELISAPTKKNLLGFSEY